MFAEKMADHPAVAVQRQTAKLTWRWIATLILFVACAFRMFSLPDNPPGLAQDEVLDADIALFIRQGEHALFFPHGYGHEPLYHYLAVPFQALIGDNVFSVRLPSVFLGLLLVALTMRWARRDFGLIVAIVTGLGLAISWWPIIFSRIGIRPILEPVLLVLAVWFWPLHKSTLSSPAIGRAGLAGLFLGLAIYSYTAARVVLLIPFLFLGYLLLTYLLERRKKKLDVTQKEITRVQLLLTTIVLVTGLVVYFPLAFTLRANPDLQQRIQQLQGPLSSLQAGDQIPVLKSTLATLGVFAFTGDPRWTYSLPFRPLFDPLSALFFFAGLIVTIRHWRRPQYALLPIWLAITLLPSALSPDAPSTVRLVGAMPVIYVLPGIAIAAALSSFSVEKISIPQIDSQRWLIVIVTILLAVLGINLYRTVNDGFVSWPADIETRLRYQTVIQDIGRHWIETKNVTGPPVITEVFFEPIDESSLRRTLGDDPSARWIQTGAGVPGAIVWPVEHQGATTSLLYVPEFAPLSPELMQLAGISARPVYRSSERPSFAVYDLSVEPLISRQFRGGDFGLDAEKSMLSLVGMSAPKTIPIPGGTSDEVSLATFWSVNEHLPSDLAVFIHLEDEEGRIVSQSDGLDAAASTLHPGDRLMQVHSMKIDEKLPVGSYRLITGLYLRNSGIRLSQSDGRDHFLLLRCENDGEGLSIDLTCDLPGVG
jgi:4-amino-4-deoxy-L-arabinose transferase-like glycosyltransferase